ncbi:carbohydrate ABC transporter permease [Rugosimonospora africana]|uniref:Sugar ABC transporter permease n=1 Tax=Rugosimonospora africana TaxID=556532 RepID=A0A8J3VQJ1_9ACTN|nr:sugar ABC transporter permease [Rugosimonospora africana]GIH14383.1 sugar ABC transporter permease [Rugosimonospora africana]
MVSVEPSTREPLDRRVNMPVSALAGRRRRGRQATPYVLALPTLIVIAALLAYPIVKMIMLSFQHLTQRDLFTGESPSWIGLGNYTAVLSDSFFWTVVVRTVVVAAVCVLLSVGLGLAVALLMRRVTPWVRILMTVAMMLVWSMPQLVSTQVFGWLVDADWGVLNWALDKIPGVDYTNHSWWVNPVQGWTVIVILVVWGAIPFIAISLYAGLSQVPRELVEAAVMDGAGPWAVFRSVTFPILRPLVGIVTTLSAIWDMGIFTQIYVIRGSKPELDYYNLAIYAYQEAFAKSQYSPGAAISILTVILMLGLMAFYVRQMFRIGDAD